MQRNGPFKEDGISGACSTYGGMRNAYNILVGKSGRKRPFGRPRRGWEHNIRLVVMEIGWDVVKWIHLAQDMDQCRSLVSTVITFAFH
jgi:hypothetical protein